MGRKMIIENEDAQAMELAAQKQEEKELSAVEADKKYLDDGETYNLHVCMDKARMYQEQMANGMLGMGAQLILIKAHEEHGNFMATIEELGLAQSSAGYAMAAARKFGANSRTFGNLGTSKLQVLTVLDDKDVQDLVTSQELPGVGTLDEIEKMSVRELKAALRKERDERSKERDALEDVVRKKEAKISDLEMENAGRQPPTKEQIAQRRLDDLRREYAANLSSVTEYIRQTMETIAKAQKIDDVTVDQLDEFVHTNDELVSDLDAIYKDMLDGIENIRPAGEEE